MRTRTILLLGATAVFGWSTACKREAVDKAEFKTAIDNSLAHHHDCAWASPVKMPAQADPSKDESARGYDALTDAGLLIREVEVKKHVVGSNQMNHYNLSDKGHSAWTPDPSRSDYGNFCFGHFNVTAIDKATPNDPSNPTQYTVSYQYEIEGVPGWATTAESRLAFPRIAPDTSIQTATATVVKGADGGWTVAPAQPTPAGK